MEKQKLKKSTSYTPGHICSRIPIVAVEMEEDRWTQNVLGDITKRTACQRRH